MSMPSSNAWICAGVTGTVAVVSELHDATAAKVPDSSRFMHSQKPPSSHTRAFITRRLLLRKMKQSPPNGSWPSSCSTTLESRSIPRRMSCGSRATRIRRTAAKFSIAALARTGPSPAGGPPAQPECPPRRSNAARCAW
jgi:hypothetical protein